MELSKDSKEERYDGSLELVFKLAIKVLLMHFSVWSSHTSRGFNSKQEGQSCMISEIKNCMLNQSPIGLYLLGIGWVLPYMPLDSCN